ncbi:MAG: FISUMP domain-containing protein [Bacteroidota bacterium]
MKTNYYMTMTANNLINRSLRPLALLFTLGMFSGCSDDDDFDCGGTTITFETEVMACNTITITQVDGGSAPYAYAINGNSFTTTATFEDVAAGNYTLTVRDNNSCLGTASITITDNLAVTATGSAFEVSAAATGGTGPYEFSIDGTNFGTSRDFAVTDSTESYTVTVRDAFGCTATSTAVPPAAIKSYTDDRDDQTYRVVRIGDLVWLGENFAYNPNVAGMDSVAFCPDGESDGCEKFGLLYQWDAANSVVPDGWRLPTEADFEALVSEVGGESTAGTNLKQGVFRAIMAGNRRADGSYNPPTEITIYWSSDESPSEEDVVISLAVERDLSSIRYADIDKSAAMSIRMIKED